MRVANSELTIVFQFLQFTCHAFAVYISFCSLHAMLLMVGWPTTWGGKRAICPPENFKIMFCCWMPQQVTFFPQKIAACGQSRRCGEVLLGLYPHKKLQAPQIEIWNTNTISHEDFNFHNVKLLHTNVIPLYWRPSDDSSGCGPVVGWFQPCLYDRRRWSQPNSTFYIGTCDFLVRISQKSCM